MVEVRKLAPSQRIRWAIGTLDVIRDEPHVAEVLPILSDTAADVFEKESAVSQAVIWAAIIGAIIGGVFTHWYFKPRITPPRDEEGRFISYNLGTTCRKTATRSDEITQSTRQQHTGKGFDSLRPHQLS